MSMDNRINSWQPPLPALKKAGLSSGKNQSGGKVPAGGLFREHLRSELTSGLKVSAHAERRLKERNIVINESDWAKVNQAVEMAASKGARESLIIYGGLALVASVKNRTVITALDEKSAQGQVFTNIDSAVIIK